MNTVPQPDASAFYFLIAFLLGSFIVWGVGYYIVSTHGYMKKLSETLEEMGKILAVHEEKHEQHERELETIRAAKVHHSVGKRREL